MEKQKFERSWGEAFDQAEVSPPEHVWTNIELDLEKAKGSQLSKRLIFYQLLAAASVVFAMGVGISVYLLGERTENTPITAVEKSPVKIEEQLKTEELLNSASKNISGNSLKNGLAHDKTSTIKGQNTSSDKNENIADQIMATDRNKNKQSSEINTLAGIAIAEIENEESSLSGMNLRLPSLVMGKKIELHLPAKEEQMADPVALMLARLQDRENEVREVKENKKIQNEKLWTSVGFAAGSFNSDNAGVSSSSPNSSLARNSRIANQEAKAPGTTYSVGVNVGTKLSERWVFQGGVNYLTQSSDYTANTAVGSADFTSFRPQSINELEKLNKDESLTQDKLVTTAPYNVNNNIRYLSIPMQAGYLIINKEFGLQLNAGVATDLFLQNTVTAEGQNLDKTTQGAGGDSPYRTVNLSGLMGTEVSYRFSQHYRIALNPGIRYPLNSIYRSAVDVKANPLSFDVGLRFRYIFH